eukprot:evm.model.NODE_16124_length_10413_cov_31.914434.2
MSKTKQQAHTTSQELRSVGLIPSVLPEGFRSTYSINATFGMLNIDPGAEVPLHALDDPAPVYSVLEARDEVYYTFILVDPDSPTPEAPHDGELLLHMVTNVPGQQADSRMGQTVVPYRMPSQNQGQSHGIHRYLLAILEQPQKGQQVVHIAPPKYRTNFSIAEYTKLYKFKLVGATFFYSSWDEAQARGTNATTAMVRLHDSLEYAQSMLEKANFLKELVLEGSVHFAVPLILRFNGETVSAGDEVASAVADTTPVVTFDSKKDQSFYTVVIVDADFPSIHQATDRALLLMLKANIPSSEGDSSVGDVILHYMPPSSFPGGTGLHRYFVLLLEQHGGILEEGAVDVPERRRGFQLHEFMKAHAGLEAVGATFFLGRRKE